MADHSRVLDGARWVIPKQKTVVQKLGGVAVGTQQNINLELDLKKQTLADIQYLLRAITKVEVAQQVKLENPPTRVAVDGSATKPIDSAERRTDVTFGNALDLALIKAIEKNLRRALERAFPWDSEYYEQWEKLGLNELLNIQSSWQWMYRDSPGLPYIPINPRREFKDKPFPISAKLILKPTRGAAGVLNHIATQRGLEFTARRGEAKGTSRMEYRGFMQQSISTLKRSRYAKDYTVYITYTKLHQSPGEKWNYGSPTVNVIAKRRARTYRRF